MRHIGTALVIGGGIAGMCTAICLARNGIAVDLVEIKRDWNMLGAGLTLNSATLAAFAKIGVLDRIAAEGATRTSRPGSVGGSTGPEVGGILRPVLHRILADATAAAGVAARTGVTFSSIDAANGAVTFTDGAGGRYDMIVGADGLASQVRQAVFPRAPRPQFTGQGCWRAIFPRPPGYDGGIFGRNRTAGFNPISREEMYLFLLQAVPDNRWMPPEQWPQLLAALVAEHDDPILREVARDLGPQSRINYRPLEKLMLPPPWHRGRVLLIGDAAHSTTPHLAYGAGLAVEDAIVLGEIVAGDVPVAETFARFMARRFERCRVVVETSVAIGAFQLDPGPPERLQKIIETAGAVISRPA